MYARDQTSHAPIGDVDLSEAIRAAIEGRPPVDRPPVDPAPDAVEPGVPDLGVFLDSESLEACFNAAILDPIDVPDRPGLAPAGGVDEAASSGFFSNIFIRSRIDAIVVVVASSGLHEC
jgi:hypothetical protein